MRKHNRQESLSMKDQRQRDRERDRDIRDRERSRESRDREIRDRDSRDRPSTVTLNNSSNSRDRKGSSTSVTSSKSTTSATTRNRNNNESTNPKKEKDKADSGGEEDVFEPTISKREVYNAMVEQETVEASKLDVEKHLESTLAICKEIETTMDELYQMKLKGETKSPLFGERKLKCMMLLTSVRKMNRLYKLRLRITKDSILDQRQKVDIDHLRLQNLIYEATHLSDQVAAVQDYNRGIDQDIKLIPVEEFYEKAPVSISRPELTKKDNHLLKIARLEYEYKQREHLEEQCLQLEKSKQTVTEEIVAKKAKLNSVTPLLEKILEAAKPLEDFYNLDISEKRKMADISKHLPSPLYVLFVSSSAYAETLEGSYSFKVKICGDVEAAEQMDKVQPSKSKKEEKEEASPMEVDEEDVDQELEEEDDEDSKRRKLKKRVSVFEEKIDLRSRILHKHPLHVEWSLDTQEGETLILRFYHLTRFHIITVVSELSIKDLSPKLSRVLTKEGNVLSDLFENDNGEESPNPSTSYILEKAEVDKFSELIPEFGRPYKWAQKLGGLVFLNEDQEEEPETKIPKGSDSGTSGSKLAKANIPGTLHLLQSRIYNKSRLCDMLKSLESGKIELPQPVLEALPARDNISVTSWDSIDFKEYESYENTRDSISENVVSPNDVFMKFIIERGQRILTVLVSVQSDFPEVAPVIVLDLKEAGVVQDYLYDQPLRHIEKEINCDIPTMFEPWKSQILLIQLRIIIDRLDNITLEFEDIIDHLMRLSRHVNLQLLASVNCGSVETVTVM